MESLQQRREELERKEQQLKDSLLKFDKFLKVHECAVIVCMYARHEITVGHLRTFGVDLYSSHFDRMSKQKSTVVA